jgi:hypothetical protein
MELRSRYPDLRGWNESDDAPYFTDKPDWAGYKNLVAWGCYAEQPEYGRPVAQIEDLDATGRTGQASRAVRRRGSVGFSDASMRRSQGHTSTNSFPVLNSGFLWISRRQSRRRHPAVS